MEKLNDINTTSGSRIIEKDKLKYKGETKNNIQTTSRVFKLPKSTYKTGQPYRFSRSQIENFINCPSCFYKLHKYGLTKPTGPAFSLNIAVDYLVKKEIDDDRKNRRVPQIFKDHKYNFIPYDNVMLEKWQNSFKGIEYQKNNLCFFGGIDELLFDEETKELIIVDTKATSKCDEITSLKNVYDEGRTYKRQLEIYAYLFHKSGFKVKNIGFLLYYNADKSKDKFNDKLYFKKTLIPIELDYSWVGSTINKMIECLDSNQIPPLNIDQCNDCIYLYSSYKFFKTSMES